MKQETSQWISLFEGSECDKIPKGNLEFAQRKSVISCCYAISSFHILILIPILPTNYCALLVYDIGSWFTFADCD